MQNCGQRLCLQRHIHGLVAYGFELDVAFILSGGSRSRAPRQVFPDPLLVGFGSHFQSRDLSVGRVRLPLLPRLKHLRQWASDGIQIVHFNGHFLRNIQGGLHRQIPETGDVHLRFLPITELGGALPIRCDQPSRHRLCDRLDAHLTGSATP